MIGLLLLFLYLPSAISYNYVPHSRLLQHKNCRSSSLFTNNDDISNDEVVNTDFNGKEFDEALKKLGPVWGRTMSEKDKETFDSVRKEQQEKAEEIYKEYPYEDIDLPILPDCNNYYSGKFEKYFWHQNSDQVYVYIPIDDKIVRKDVKANFQARQVTVSIKGEEEVSFQCMERIIPDGSFWTFESDQNGQRYIQLDLEKRFRMINWKSLFGEAVEEDLKVLEDRAQLLDKLLAANKGLSKMSGVEPETMKEMMANGDLAKMIADQVYTEPQVTISDSDGNELDLGRMDSDGNDDAVDVDEIIDREASEDNIIDIEEAEGSS